MQRTPGQIASLQPQRPPLDRYHQVHQPSNTIIQSANTIAAAAAAARYELRLRIERPFRAIKVRRGPTDDPEIP